MLKARLDAGDAKNATKTLWFNAWRYEGREEAQSALIHAVLAKLAEDRQLWQDAKETFERLAKGASVLKVGKFIAKSTMTLTPDISGLIDCFKEESEKIAETMEGFDNDFEALLKKANVSRIVVFIDDLDRCSSAKVIETFETIKLFLNTPACTFVIGADAAKIEQAVGEAYKVTDPKRQKDYLEKIVQIPFTIPEQDLKDIACYVGMLVVSRHVSDESWTRLIEARPTFYEAQSIEVAFYKWPDDNLALFPAGAEEVLNELKGVMPHAASLGRGLRGNPRQIKRFLNILSLRQLLAAENKLVTDPALLVKLAVLEYVWPEFFKAVVETVDPVTGRSDLVTEIVKLAEEDGERATESKMVGDALAQPGLVNYLLLQPVITDAVDLNPYLFLAQTALGRERPAGLLPIDEQAKSLASGIQSDDRIRSKMAAKRAAALEPAGAAAVTRLLVADFAAAKAAGPRVGILSGLLEICERHSDQFPLVVKLIEDLDTAGQDGVAVAAVTLLDSASKRGLQVPAELRDRLVKGAPIAAALAPKKRTGTPGSGRR
jgi:hypothetical protein